MIRFGRNVCGDYEQATRREWLVTNGIGGYASGTISGALTRNYHGYLIAALNPPVERYLLLTKFNETIVYLDQRFQLYTDTFVNHVIEPQGYQHIEAFYLDDTMPVWHFRCKDALIEKRIWMEYGENTTYIRYKVLNASDALQLNIEALAHFRNHHNGCVDDSPELEMSQVESGLAFVVEHQGQTHYYLYADRSCHWQLYGAWREGYHKAVEAYRELEAIDCNYRATKASIELRQGESVTFVASTTYTTAVDSDVALRHFQQRQAMLTQHLSENAPDDVWQLTRAADQFIVKRSEGHSIIAGYPWFSDWGRDTMIALPGLTLSTNRYDIAESILRTFAKYVDRGMLPNRFPDEGEAPEYNTVDATLWYFEAVRAYYEATQDLILVTDLIPLLEDIIEWHRKGTRYGIRVDPEDGLLCSGEAGVQLTWMDVKIQDWVVTPRTGKAVEINALWYNALMVMASFAQLTGRDDEPYTHMAQQVQVSFQRFWNGDYLNDVIDTPSKHADTTIRPNQLFAVSLYHSPLSASQQKAVVDVCARHLLTSHGLRSLSPEHPDYIGVYKGGIVSRDSAYHQGTVWGWLIGAFVDAHLRVYQNVETATQVIQPLMDHLSDATLGTISEIFDGDEPHHARGAFAQAWSISEVLRSWWRIERLS